MIFESVINISVGNDLKAFNEIYNSVISQKSLVDVHRDVDHNRSVFTIASNNLSEVFHTCELLIEASFSNLDYSVHEGEHPRIGIVDVIPFVKYDEILGLINYETDLDFKNDVIDFAKKINSSYETPIFFYDYACTGEIITLPQIRKNAFKNLKANIGKNVSHSKYGAIALGIRNPLIAINVDLLTTDISIAKNIASTIRESNGGYKGVRALGIKLESQNRVQVSMNIVDLASANAGEICLKVKELATQANIQSEVELVGLIPKYHFDILSQDFLNWADLDINCTVENRTNY